VVMFRLFEGSGTGTHRTLVVRKLVLIRDTGRR